jgi:hypothetical protein
MLKILIIGDSFAADWSVKYNNYKGWPQLLAEQYEVTNIAQAGVCEYKIYKQLLSVKNLSVYDWVIVSHTGSFRVNTLKHPIHSNDKLHKNADLIYTDIDYHSNKLKNIFNKSLKAAVLFYKYHFDPEYFETTYQLLREKINSILKDKKTIIISNLKRDTNYENENIVLDYSNYHNTEGGLVNHFSEKGNQEIYQNLIKILNSLK